MLLPSLLPRAALLCWALARTAGANLAAPPLRASRVIDVLSPGGAGGYGGAAFVAAESAPEELAAVAAFALRRVRRAERWRAPAAPVARAALEGIEARELVHSEDGGLTRASVTLQRRVAEVGLGDTTEDVEEFPAFGRAFWVSALATRAGGAGAARHRLVVTLGIPHGEASVYSHVFADVDGGGGGGGGSSGGANEAPPTATADPSSTRLSDELRAVSYNTWNSNRACSRGARALALRLPACPPALTAPWCHDARRRSPHSPAARPRSAQVAVARPARPLPPVRPAAAAARRRAAPGRAARRRAAGGALRL